MSIRLVLSGETVELHEPSFGEYLAWRQQFKQVDPTYVDWLALIAGKDAAWINSLPTSEGVTLANSSSPIIQRILEALGVKTDLAVRQH